MNLQNTSLTSGGCSAHCFCRPNTAGQLTCCRCGSTPQSAQHSQFAAAAAPVPASGPRTVGDCPLGARNIHKWSLLQGQQCEYCMQTRAEISAQIDASESSTAASGPREELLDISTLLRHFEDVLIPMWRGDEITDALRKMARGLWERAVDANDALRVPVRKLSSTTDALDAMNRILAEASAFSEGHENSDTFFRIQGLAQAAISRLAASGLTPREDESFSHMLTCSRWVPYDHNHKRYVPSEPCNCKPPMDDDMPMTPIDRAAYRHVNDLGTTPDTAHGARAFASFKAGWTEAVAPPLSLTGLRELLTTMQNVVNHATREAGLGKGAVEDYGVPSAEAQKWIDQLSALPAQPPPASSGLREQIEKLLGDDAAQPMTAHPEAEPCWIICQSERNELISALRPMTTTSALVKASEAALAFLNTMEWNDHTSETNAEDVKAQLDAALSATPKPASSGLRELVEKLEHVLVGVETIYADSVLGSTEATPPEVANYCATMVAKTGWLVDDLKEVYAALRAATEAGDK